MSITHYGRAIDELKRAGCFNIEEIKKGRSGANKFSSDDVENVLNWSKYNIFESLNRAGKFLKDSSWTRLTTHKKYDFALIQSQSNTNCERYRQELRDLIKVQDSNNNPQQSELDDEAKQRISSGARRYLNDAVKELKKVYDLAKKDEELKQKLDEFEKKDEQEKIECLKKAFEYLHRNCGLSEKIILKERDEYTLEDAFISGGLASIGMGLPLLLLLGEGLGIACGLPMLAIGAFFMGLAIREAVKDYRKATAKKRQFMKLNDHFSEAIRKLNECQKYVEHQTLHELKQSAHKATMNGEVFESTIGFLNKQKELWNHYVTAHAREYEKNKARQVVNDTHRSGSKIVSDEKADRHGYQKRLGLTKQGVAVSWCELPDVFSSCYEKYYKQPT